MAEKAYTMADIDMMYRRSWISRKCKGEKKSFDLSDVGLVEVFTMFFDLRDVLCLSLPSLFFWFKFVYVFCF